MLQKKKQKTRTPEGVRVAHHIPQSAPTTGKNEKHGVDRLQQHASAALKLSRGPKGGTGVAAGPLLNCKRGTEAALGAAV